MIHMGCFERLSELFFPSNIYCAACGALIDATSPYALCDKCLGEIRWNTGRTCAKCGKSLEEDFPDGAEADRCDRASQRRDRGKDLCFECEAEGRAFRKGFSCVTYAGRARDIVRALKYKDRAYIAEKAAEMMRDRILVEIDEETGEVFSPDVILPVPMHIKKRRKRGYDQAALIAKRLARCMNVPYDEYCIARKKQTSVMSSLSRDERKRNLVGAFGLAVGAAERVEGKDVLLVDDVFTTGATADACASILLEAGAANVDVFVFASGANARAKG